METRDFLKILKKDIHSTVFATVDENGLPTTRVIDIMLVDDESLYFITAKGKEFYKQLINKGYVSLSGMTNGDGSMNKKAISIAGKVKEAEDSLLEDVFRENPYMEEIYPSSESRMALKVFCLYEGKGEYFDLSTKPITRHSFSLGQAKIKNKIFVINDNCTRCGKCYTKCPQKCITIGKTSIINQEHCLHCGNCIEVCPFGAVEKK